MNVARRSYAFAFAAAALALLVAWAAHSAWNDLARQKFALVQTDSFHLAHHIEAYMQALNQTALHFALRQDPAGLAAFQRQTVETRQWLTTNKSHASTSPQRDLLSQIQVSFDHYAAHIAELFEARLPNGAQPEPQSVPERLEKEAAPVLSLAAELRAVEQRALDQFVKDSHRDMRSLQALFLASVALALTLALTAARLAYVARIAPLTDQLLQSRLLNERHEKLAALGTLAAGVAHEIRNPLTAINVRLHGLKKALSHGTSEHEHAIVIEQEIRRLERIVKDFLQFARPSDPQVTTVAAGTLFGQVRSLLGSQLEKSNLLLKIELPAEVWIRADPQQIEQVLINLVQNAAESLEPGGAITLRAKTTVRPVAGRETPFAVLEVADTGPGIPPEAQERLFDPFFSTKPTGTGLGLSIAVRIVEKHGGALDYQTKAGRGTTFAISLPSAQPDNHDPQSTPH